MTNFAATRSPSVIWKAVSACVLSLILAGCGGGDIQEQSASKLKMAAAIPRQQGNTLVMLAPVVVFSDNFSGATIDTRKWTTGGNTVSLVGGELHVDQAVTDNGGYAQSTWFVVDPSKNIIVDRDVKVQFANSFYSSQFWLEFSGFSDTQRHGFGTAYANMTWGSGDGNCIANYGFFATKNGANPHCGLNRPPNVSAPFETVWGQWFHEKLIYSPQSGELQVYHNTVLVNSFQADTLPVRPGIRARISLNSWGWWTGHYQYMKNLIVTQSASSAGPVASKVLNYSLTPASLDFGGTSDNASAAAQTITLVNTGNAELSVFSLSLIGAEPNDFRVVNNTCTGVIAVAGQCSFGVEFRPTAENSRTASVMVASNANQATPQVSVSGLGIAAAVPDSNPCASNFTRFIHSTACHLMENLRDNFMMSTDDVGNQKLFQWLNVKKNRDLASSWEAFFEFGQMVQGYYGGGPWRKDSQDKWLDYTVGVDKVFIEAESVVKPFIVPDSPAFRFLGGTLDGLGNISDAIDAYNAVSAHYNAGNARSVLQDYIQRRCSNGSCDKDASQAKSEIKTEDDSLISSMLCAEISNLRECPAGNPNPEQVDDYMKQLEVSYSAYRLVGYGDISRAIRTGIGKALAQIANDI